MSEFILIACLACAVLSASSALMGCFLIVERKSLLGDMIGHSVLPGIGIGFILAGFEKNILLLFFGALASALFSTFLQTYLTHKSRIKSDVSMAVLLTGFYATGIVIINYLQKSQGVKASGLESYILGQASALGTNELIIGSGLLLFLSIVIFTFYKELRLSIFDSQFAISQGINDKRFKALLAALISITVIFSLPAVGVILASALLILPAACATLLTKNMASRLALSVLIGATMGFLGAYLSSIYSKLPTGPSLILTHLFLFISIAFVLLLTRRKKQMYV